MASGSDGPAQLGVQRLDGVRCVDNFADAFGEREERNDKVPVAAPALRDRRILLAPRTLYEGIEGGLADLGIGRAATTKRRWRSSIGNGSFPLGSRGGRHYLRPPTIERNRVSRHGAPRQHHHRPSNP